MAQPLTKPEARLVAENLFGKAIVERTELLLEHIPANDNPSGPEVEFGVGMEFPNGLRNLPPTEDLADADVVGSPLQLFGGNVECGQRGADDILDIDRLLVLIAT